MYVLHTECARLCTGPALLQQYKYFVVINNGMRGPFARANQGMELHHWTRPFIDKLNSHVRRSLTLLKEKHGMHVTDQSHGVC